MTVTLLNQLYGNITSTVIAIIVILISYLLVKKLWLQNIQSHRLQQKYKNRLRYIFCVIFLLLLARIWIEGFTHLLTILGLVSAALVITNKETIMNFFGWLIIIWRELFIEGDLIKIQQYRGYVKSLGVLYFTLHEVSNSYNGYTTGKVIRIPNGLITNNAIINMSQTQDLLEQMLEFRFHKVSDVEQSIQIFKNKVDNIIFDYYKDNEQYSQSYFKKNNKEITSMHLNSRILIQPKLDNEMYIDCVIYYYCFMEDAEKLQQKIYLNIIELCQRKQSMTACLTE